MFLQGNINIAGSITEFTSYMMNVLLTYVTTPSFT